MKYFSLSLAPYGVFRNAEIIEITEACSFATILTDREGWVWVGGWGRLPSVFLTLPKQASLNAKGRHSFFQS